MTAPNFTLLVGDVLDQLTSLPDESVHCVVTSPPYWGLRDYGVDGQIGLEATPDMYVNRIVAVFREVRRVLRSDGTCWINIGDSYNSGSSGGLGGSTLGGGKSNQAASNRHGRPLLDALKPKDLVGIPWRVAFALQADGWWLRSEIIWAKPNPMPESVTDRPTKAHEQVFLLTKSARYFYDADAVREPHTSERWGGPEASGTDEWKYRNVGDKVGIREREGRTFYPEGGRNLRSVWTIPTEPYPDAHFATYPTRLVEPCVKAGCPERGTVLDPFLGSGTTAFVALSLGRNAIGIELNPEYAELARRRVARWDAKRMRLAQTAMEVA